VLLLAKQYHLAVQLLPMYALPQLALPGQQQQQQLWQQQQQQQQRQQQQGAPRGGLSPRGDASGGGAVLFEEQALLAQQATACDLAAGPAAAPPPGAEAASSPLAAGAAAGRPKSAGEALAALTGASRSRFGVRRALHSAADAAVSSAVTGGARFLGVSQQLASTTAQAVQAVQAAGFPRPPVAACDPAQDLAALTGGGRTGSRFGVRQALHTAAGAAAGAAGVAVTTAVTGSAKIMGASAQLVSNTAHLVGSTAQAVQGGTGGVLGATAGLVSGTASLVSTAAMFAAEAAAEAATKAAAGRGGGAAGAGRAAGSTAAGTVKLRAAAGLLDAPTAEGVVVGVSRELLGSATSLEDPAVAAAEAVLCLLPPDCKVWLCALHAHVAVTAHGVLLSCRRLVCGAVRCPHSPSSHVWCVDAARMHPHPLPGRGSAAQLGGSATAAPRVWRVPAARAAHVAARQAPAAAAHPSGAQHLRSCRRWLGPRQRQHCIWQRRQCCGRQQRQRQRRRRQQRAALAAAG
jgi:hypothetical protein